MPIFDQSDLEGFGREAIRPYLSIKTYMERESYAYGSKTVLWKWAKESPDKKLVIAVLVLQFRSGVFGVVSELWTCYEDDGVGAGLVGLDERYDIGKILSPWKAGEDFLHSLLAYFTESDKLLGAGMPFADTLEALSQKFKQHISVYQQPFPQTESAEPEPAAPSVVEDELDDLVSGAMPLEAIGMEAAVDDSAERTNYRLEKIYPELGTIVVNIRLYNKGNLEYNRPVMASSLNWFVDGYFTSLDLRSAWCPSSDAGNDGQRIAAKAIRDLISRIDDLIANPIFTQDGTAYGRFMRKLEIIFQKYRMEFGAMPVSS